MSGIGGTGWAALAAGAAALLCLGVGLTGVVLAARGVGDRPAQLTHAAMGLGMAGMFSPWGDPVPAWPGAVAFAGVGVGFAVSALRARRPDGVHLVISCAAMALMYLLHRPTAAAGHGTSGGGHALHGGAGEAVNLLVLPLALGLAGYFVWHAWQCTDRARSRQAATAAPVTGAAAVRSRGAVEPVAHATMSLLMAAMFLGMA